MANTIQGESSSTFGASNSTPTWKYDVFLSFRGEDTRLTIADHLYDAFKSSGIRTFRDNEGLEKGEVIKAQLIQAIKDSRCAVVVLSQNYANSKWCLDELQQILERKNEMGGRVFPIFYDVDPSDVRNQKERVGEALANLEKRLGGNMDTVQIWKNSLSEIGNMCGWDARSRPQTELIEEVVGAVWKYLCSKLPFYDDNLIGTERRMGDLMSCLEIGLDDIRFIGIWGMGGVGKTTLARVVYEQISDRFEMCCFLANVRETLQTKGLVSLQKRLLSQIGIKEKIHNDDEGRQMIRNLFHNKKVLLVLDDLYDEMPLEKMAESPDWFGKGSRIIMTTRNKHVLTSCEGKIYEMKAMEKDESLQLFSKKAFKKDHPEEDYLELSKSVVAYTGGLPLALKILGSFLCGRKKDEWAATLNRLKRIPDKNILLILKISYDGLHEEEKTIFLDIVCCFRGWEKDKVILLLEGCDLNPKIGIKVLIEKTLLVETKNYLGYPTLEMHDLLEELGRDIIRRESSNPSNRRRLCEFKDIKEVLENNKGSEAIEAIGMLDVLQNPGNKLKIKVHPKAFSKMNNIRLLIVGEGNYCVLPRKLKLSSALKVVCWPQFPLETLPLPLDKLVDIEMPKSKIKQLWNGRQCMKKLKCIDLKHSYNLIETPDFSRVPNLEHLNLSWCESLVTVHPSLGKLTKLVEVNLSWCTNLKSLPRKLETNSLQKLDLSGCGVAKLPEFGKGVNKLSYLDVSYTAITTLPEFGEGVNELSYLDVSHSAITTLPKSFGSLTGLGHLDLGSCKILDLDKLKTLITRQISKLDVTLLTELYLTLCGLNDGSLLDNFGGLSSLIVLDLSQNFFVNLPTGCFSGLFRLLYLFLDDCKRLKSLPWLPPRLIHLSISNCFSMEPLSDGELWNLVASTDHEDRGRIEFANTGEIKSHANNHYGFENTRMFEEVKSEYLPQRDFIAIVPTGCEIPSWCTSTKYILDEYGQRCEIEVEIPQHFRASDQWFGIVVCLELVRDRDCMIWWSSSGAEDDGYMLKKWAHAIPMGLSSTENECMKLIMVLELNEKTCWQHLTPHNNSLHILLSTLESNVLTEVRIRGCGWRLINKEEMQECSLPPTPRQVKLSQRLLSRAVDQTSFD